jgi:hypothetical protein
MTGRRAEPSLTLPATTNGEAVPASVAAIRAGSFEQHGPHLPLATDTLTAKTIADAIRGNVGLPRPPRWQRSLVISLYPLANNVLMSLSW